MRDWRVCIENRRQPTLASGDDPTVKQLELEMAAIFAKEAAVFVPSGTMGNLIAVGVHCEVRGSEFICGNLSHIHVYEQGGLSTLMGAHPRVIANKNDGTMDLDEIRGAVRANDQHFPVTRVLCIEQTHNKCGGRVLTLDYVVGWVPRFFEIDSLTAYSLKGVAWFSRIVSYHNQTLKKLVSNCLSNVLFFLFFFTHTTS